MPTEESLKRASEYVYIDEGECTINEGECTIKVVFKVGAQSFTVAVELLTNDEAKPHCEFIHKMFIKALAKLLDNERAQGLDQGALICAAQGYPGLSHMLLHRKPPLETP